MRKHPKHAAVFCAVCVLLLTLEACAASHFRVSAPGVSASTVPKSQNVHATFWGLKEPEITPNCRDNALSEVTAKIKWHQALLATGTLGTYVPMTVEWKCAKDAHRGQKDF